MGLPQQKTLEVGYRLWSVDVQVACSINLYFRLLLSLLLWLCDFIVCFRMGITNIGFGQGRASPVEACRKAFRYTRLVRSAIWRHRNLDTSLNPTVFDIALAFLHAIDLDSIHSNFPVGFTLTDARELVICSLKIFRFVALFRYEI